MNECFCYTCGKEFHSLGIARHRAMHREKYEDCEIAYKDGRTYKHQYSELKSKDKG